MSTQKVSCAENMELALAREAVKCALKQLRERKIEAEFIEATNDPLFMQDLHDCMRDWAELDRDSLQYIDCEPDYE